MFGVFVSALPRHASRQVAVKTRRLKPRSIPKRRVLIVKRAVASLPRHAPAFAGGSAPATSPRSRDARRPERPPGGKAAQFRERAPQGARRREGREYTDRQTIVSVRRIAIPWVYGSEPMRSGHSTTQTPDERPVLQMCVASPAGGGGGAVGRWRWRFPTAMLASTSVMRTTCSGRQRVVLSPGATGSGLRGGAPSPAACRPARA